MGTEQFSLCWDNFHRNMSSGMHSMLESEDLVDVTLAIEGQYLKAHKMVLSVCSPYFRKLFSMNPCKHPIVFMKDVSYLVMNDLLTFMYQGEVQVNQENLAMFIKTAEALQIRGLTSDTNEGEEPADDSKAPKRAASEEPTPSKSVKKVATQAAKKPKLSAPMTNNNSPAPALSITPHQKNNSKPEIETIPLSKNESLVDFKMEPYEIADTEYSEAHEGENQDSYIEDDSQLEEDYSVMESDEPQAGTSGDGLADSQDLDFGNLMQGWRKFSKRITSVDDERLNGEFHVIRRHPQGKHKDCLVCSNRKVKGQRHLTPYYCITCSHSPGLHPQGCFKRYHTVKYYK